jgi:hypothetical protein
MRGMDHGSKNQREELSTRSRVRFHLVYESLYLVHPMAPASKKHSQHVLRIAALRKTVAGFIESQVIALWLEQQSKTHGVAACGFRTCVVASDLVAATAARRASLHKGHPILPR